MAEPYLTITPHPVLQHRVQLNYVDYGKPFVVEWGDGARSDGDPQDGAAHNYPRAGGWQAQVFDADTRDFLDQTLVVVRGGREPVGITVGVSASDPYVCEVAFTDTGDGTGVLPRFTVEWPKTKDHVTTWGVPGQMVTRKLPVGTHDVYVRDETTRRFATKQVDIVGPSYDPDWTVQRQAGANTRTVELTFTQVTAGKKVILAWDDGTQDAPDSVAVGDTFTHEYPDPGGTSHRYTIIVAYDDGTGESKSEGITVPLS